MGLVHEAAPAGKIDERVQAVVSEILKGGPLAQRAAKRLIRQVAGMPRDQAIAETLRIISEIRVSPEAQEGLSAFLEKRKPNW
jgi:methylglutaconyl-CoA hydratase